jgi:hypothetical protein
MLRWQFTGQMGGANGKRNGRSNGSGKGANGHGHGNGHGSHPAGDSQRLQVSTGLVSIQPASGSPLTGGDANP